jgi:hypothetical protein
MLMRSPSARDDGADVQFLARGLGPTTGLGIDVAGAPVDSLQRDADRAGLLSLQYVVEMISVTGREPPFGIKRR